VIIRGVHIMERIKKLLKVTTFFFNCVLE